MIFSRLLNKDPVLPGACAGDCVSCALNCHAQMLSTKRATPHIGEIFPDFVAPSSFGQLHFHNWAEGHWVHLFSQPRAYSPVGSSELVELARHSADFAALGVRNLALAPSSVLDQRAWADELERSFEVRIDFPQVDDGNLAVSQQADMIHGQESDRMPIRKSFIIDPSLRVRMIFDYPINIGRSVQEILRVFEALQTVEDLRDVCIPADWHDGDPLLIDPAATRKDADRDFGEMWHEVRPYYRVVDL